MEAKGVRRMSLLARRELKLVSRTWFSRYDQRLGLHDADYLANYQFTLFRGHTGIGVFIIRYDSNLGGMGNSYATVCQSKVSAKCLVTAHHI